MRIISTIRAIMPEGKHAMAYRVRTPAGVYLIHIDEVVKAGDSLVYLPRRILTGIRPTLLTLQGGCYEITFDLESNINNGTPFKRPESCRQYNLSIIIAHIINNHYTAHKPYCYTFLAYNKLLARVYRRALLGILTRYPSSIKKIHRNLDPDRRGYAIELY